MCNGYTSIEYFKKRETYSYITTREKRRFIILFYFIKTKENNAKGKQKH